MSDHTAPHVADAACSPACARDYEATHDHQTVPACSCCHDHETAHSHDHGHNHAQVDADLGASDCGCTSCACHSHSGPEDADHEKRELLLMGVSAVLFAIGMLADTQLERVLPRWLVLALCYVLPYALCGFAVLKSGLQSILQKDFFNEFTLMGGATVAAIALGQLPEAVGVMLFYRVGEFVQERAAGRSRRSVRALLAARPSVAHELLDGGTTRDVAPDVLGPGSHILVRPGEKIPLDGEVLEGRSQVDTSPLTGESVPQQVAPGGRVLAGTINLNSALRVEVTAPFAESSIARILEMVENAVARKAPTERFITRMARWYTPAVTGLALLVAVLPPLLGLGTFSQWLYRALVLLVISCPCALLISIPLGYFGGIGPPPGGAFSSRAVRCWTTCATCAWPPWTRPAR